METKYIAALIAFLGGSLISLINAVITAKQVASENRSAGSASLMRQVLSMAYLALTWFVIRKMGIDQLFPLLGAAIGLTVPAILFTITIAKHMKGDD
ncbi:MAG: hypothetical protein IKP86_09290 [Anaerolineaceae bacterium]|nr:hypothetical protein [Anaerolineaceae bacterium]